MIHLGSMIKAEKFKLPSMTFSVGAMHEVKEEDRSSQEDKHIQEGVFKGFGSEAICKESVWRLKEDSEILLFTVQISISVFWSQKAF